MSFGFANHTVIRNVATAALLLSSSSAVFAQSSEVLREVTSPEIRDIEASKESRSPAQQKISSHLLDAIGQQANGQLPDNVPGVRINRNTPIKKGALIDIDAQVSDGLLQTIKSAGGTIVNFHQEEHAVRAYIPLDKIEGVAGRPEVNSIVPAARATTNGIPSNGEGTVAHGVDDARKAFKVSGQNVKVGVISDSIDDVTGALKRSIARKAMSAKLLSWLPEQKGEGAAEGLAMAEIIHSIAPDAKIVFATGNNGAAQMAANIRALQKAGCAIIVDDMTYFNESPFQDGPIARAVNDVTKLGVLYFSSARNSGSKRHGTAGTWEGDFADGGPATGAMAGDSPHILHKFDEGITANRVLNATNDRVDLFWADPLGKSKNDYSLYVIDADGHVVQSSTTSHTGTQDPYQWVSGVNSGQSIVITKAASAKPLFLHLDSGRSRLAVTTTGNVRGHNASGAQNAFSVAAVRVAKPPVDFATSEGLSVETFSSDGPRRMFFDDKGNPLTPDDFSSKGGRLLNKPDIAAADGVSTSLGNSKLNPFFGTSAAAPHAAGIAALLLSYDRQLGPEEAKEFLISSAVPLEGNAWNPNAGAGIIMPFPALAALCKKRGTSSCPAQTRDNNVASKSRVGSTGSSAR